MADHPEPTLASGEALIRVTLAGICNTDLEITRGYVDFKGVLGHEFVGIVERAPSASLVGQRVVGEINCICGACRQCRAGLPSHCSNRTVLGIAGRDGALAEFVALPERNLHLVPDSVADDQAVFVEPLAAALQVLEQTHVRPTQSVVILGDGKLGLLVAQVVALTGAKVVTIGHHRDKLSIISRLGIATSLAEGLGDETADVVVECTGRPEGLALARQLVRPKGAIVLKSTFAGQVQLNLNSIVVDEVALIGSRCGPFEASLRLLARGLVEVRPLISAVFPMDQAEAAFERAGVRGALKVLVAMRGD